MQVEIRRSKPKLSTDLHSGENAANFKKTIFFNNQTCEDLVVVDVNNFPIVVEKKHGFHHTNGGLLIRVVYHFQTRNCIINSINQLHRFSEIYGSNDPTRIMIEKAILDYYNNNPYGTNCTIILDHYIPHKEITDNPLYYLEDLDLMICSDRGYLDAPHPRSIEGKAYQEHKDLVSKKLTGVFIQLVDNENEFHKRFIYLGNQVMEVPAVKSSDKKSGVYFTRISSNVGHDSKLDLEYMTVDEAEQIIGLHKSKEEAIAGGDPAVVARINESKLKESLNELKHEREKELHALESDKIVLQKVKLESEAKILALEKQLEENKKTNELIKADLEKEKMELEKEKAKRIEESEKRKQDRSDEYEDRKATRSDYYERRSYERKDSHEIVKYIPAVLLGFAGAFALLKNKG